MVYQEQVMQTAQVLGGYSLGGADLLRRAMGKKKVEEMVVHRATFREGAAKNNISETKADEIFDLMEKFAGYGFNKSHAAAYSLLAYHTGWLKVHYRAEFFCANMTVEMDNTDKLKVLYEDALREGLSFEMPDVNRGMYRFEPVSDTVIRYGLGAVKGTGEAAIEAIIAAREGRGTGLQGDVAGPFKSLFDFCVRVDRQRINKRTVEALIKAGAFDAILRDRASLLASIDLAFDFASATHDNANQGGLFDAFDDGPGASTEEPPLVARAPFGVREQLQLEKTAVGFYLSGHLFDEVEAEVRRFARRRIADLGDTRDQLTLAGVIGDLRIINGQRGKLALFKLDDKTASIEATADERVINAAKALLKDDETVVVSALMQPDRFSGGFRLKINQVWSLAQARCRYGRFLRVVVGQAAPDVRALIAEFPPQTEFTPEGDLRHGLPVRIALERRPAPGGVSGAHPGAADGAGSVGVTAELELGERAWIYPSDEAIKSWMAQADEGRVAVVYE
jgi:DNA polymerase-3 subunit alpha